MRMLYLCVDRGIPLHGAKGASTHVRQIAAALQDAGHEVTLGVRALSGDNPSPSVTRIIALAKDADAQGTQLKDVLARHHIDVVLERYALNSGAAAVAAAAHGLPLVYEINAPIVLEAARYRGLTNVPAALERERHVLGAATSAIVVSNSLRSYLHSVAPHVPVTVVGNGVDLHRFRRATPRGGRAGPITISFVGSMKPWHGVHNLVTAFRAIADRHPDTRLILAGHGPALASIRDQVADTGLQARVQIMGPVRHDQVPDILARTDIAAAPYRGSDDFYFSPLKILEYMAAGLPVVYPNIGDLPALVGDAGLAYPCDDVGALVHRIDRLIDEPALRHRMGGAAIRRAQRHGWGRVAEQVGAELAQAAARPLSRRLGHA